MYFLNTTTKLKLPYKERQRDKVNELIIQTYAVFENSTHFVDCTAVHRAFVPFIEMYRQPWKHGLGIMLQIRFAVGER